MDFPADGETGQRAQPKDGLALELCDIQLVDLERKIKERINAICCKPHFGCLVRVQTTNIFTSGQYPM